MVDNEKNDSFENTGSYGDLLPREKISEIKSLIDKKLKEQNVYDNIQKLIKEQAISISSNDPNNQQHSLLNTVLESDIIQQVINSVSIPSHSSIVYPTEKIMLNKELRNRSEHTHYMQLTLLDGSAFLDELIHDDDSSETQTFLRVALAFQRQRFRSKDVKYCMEPEFNDNFLMAVHIPSKVNVSDQTNMELSKIASIQDPIYMTVLKITKQQVNSAEYLEVNREILATHKVEWRYVLTDSLKSIALPIELHSGGQARKVRISCGILKFRLTFISDIKAKENESCVIPKSKLNMQLSKEESSRRNNERLFYQYAKCWWHEYLESNRDLYKKRNVKIFAEDELGEYRFVCSFLCVLRAKRIVSSPKEAARFVSLIPFYRKDNIGGDQNEMWFSLHGFLTLGKGDGSDHAVLLASLLLGFGLEAYIFMGTIFAGAQSEVVVNHTWVATRNRSGDIKFWEPITGEQFEQNRMDDDPNFLYNTIDCAFTPDCFYANLQSNNSISCTLFDFENVSFWKPMDQTVVKKLPQVNSLSLLQIEDSQLINKKIDILENSLRRVISKYRKDNFGSRTKWDDGLEYLLTPSLGAYELERIWGVQGIGNEEFQEGIKRYVPEGFTFKGFPMMFSHVIPDQILRCLVKTRTAKDILETKGDCISFGLCTRIFPYPENIAAVWVMLAVKYRQIS